MNAILYTIINNTFQLIQMLIMIRVLLSWIPHDPYSQFIYAIYRITDIVLQPIRDLLPLSNSRIDFSPIIAFFLIDFFKKIILTII